jgi:3-hydroxyanthranilate 3,4-dioxygenase
MQEFFYQLKGDMLLKVVWDHQFIDIPIKEGEIFLLPGNTPHSPQRFADTVGLVIEIRRKPENTDRLRWYCDNEACKALLYEESFKVPNLDLGAQLKPVIERFYASEDLRLCKKCGTVHAARNKAPQ